MAKGRRRPGGGAGRGAGRGTKKGGGGPASKRQKTSGGGNDITNSTDTVVAAVYKSDLIHTSSLAAAHVTTTSTGRKVRNANANANSNSVRREYYVSAWIPSPPPTGCLAGGTSSGSTSRGGARSSGTSTSSSGTASRGRSTASRSSSASRGRKGGTGGTEGTGGDVDDKLWRISVGDAVSVQFDGANPPSSEGGSGSSNKKEKELWFPHRAAWCPVQILSIYRDVSVAGPVGPVGGASSSGGTTNHQEPIKLEVRRLYRRTDLAEGEVPGLLGDCCLDQHHRLQRQQQQQQGRGVGKGNKKGNKTSMMKDSKKGDDNVGIAEEVMETYRIMDNVDITSVLGKVRLVDEEGREFGIFDSRKRRKGAAAGAAAAGGGGGGGGGKGGGDADDDDGTIDVPTVNLLCHRMYSSNEERIMPIVLASYRYLDRALAYSRLIQEDGGLKRAVQRRLGVAFRDENSLLSSIGMDATARVPPPLLVPSTSTTMAKSSSTTQQQQQQQQQRRLYFDSARLPVNWSAYQYGRDVIGNLESTARWTARLGEVVAVRCDDAHPPRLNRYVEEKGGNEWYPFTNRTRWRPCRVVAIYSDELDAAAPSSKGSKFVTSWQDVDDATEVKFELQLLYRIADAEAAGNIPLPSCSKNNDLEASADVDLIEMDEITEVDGTTLLGPVTIAAEEDGNVPDRWKTDARITSRTPPVFHRCSKSFNSERQCVEGLGEDAAERLVRISSHYSENRDLAERVKRTVRRSRYSHDDEGIREEAAASVPLQEPESSDGGDDGGDESPNRGQATIYRRDVKAAAAAFKRGAGFRTSLDSADNELSHVADDDEMEADEDYAAWTTGSPYHVDVSSSKSFYTQLHINPPYDHYVKKYQDPPLDLDDDAHWTVSLGDTVAVHFDIGGTSEASLKFPFTTTWSPAEVVCIWKQHQSNEDLVELKERSTDGDDEVVDDNHEVRIEIRWLYRQHEMPGSARQAFSYDKSGGLEEVVETDDLLECPAASLLAPVNLYSSSVSCSIPTVDAMGMPVMSYQCHRFWSIQRKSLMPSGAAKGRVERGRMYSKYFGKDALLKAALDKALRGDDQGLAQPLPSASSGRGQLKSNFRDAISRLSLSDASADAQVRGMELTGRKKELNQIKDFLRSAIQGSKNEFEGVESSVKSSIFIAGPPGTGKTACVCAVIAQLRHEQASGDIPPFDFVSLNGMEMQYPFDAYVRLWEAVSKLKEKRSPGVAAAMLERHFVGGGGKKSNSTEDRNSRRPVTVVLLDEIDYLVTNKQSVLYNFFEWPRRSASNGSAARLVVVGISNTINLPERLKPAVQSRLGRERCVFKAYNVEETCNILKARLIGGDGTKNVSSVFDQDALTFAARKTAVLSGDIRKAFQICKSAAETMLSNIEEEAQSSSSSSSSTSSSNKIVRIPHIQKAARDMFNSIINRAVASATSFEALLIVSIASLQKHTGREKGGFDVQEILTKMKGVAESMGDTQYLPAPNFSELLGILNRLGESRVITLQTPKGLHASYHASLGGGGGAWPLVSLRMEDYEVEAALRGTPHSALAEKHLADGRLFGF